MIDLTKYDFDDDDIVFLLEIENACISGQNEIILEYKGKSFVLEPLGKSVQVVEVADEVAGKYESFDDLLLGYKIDGKPLIELVKDLEYGD